MGSQRISKMKKILILVMSHETEDEVFKTYKKTWENIISINENIYPINVLFLYSKNNIDCEYMIEQNNLYSKCEENYWSSLLIKTMSGFKFFYNNDYDFVFKTNLSTIVNFKKLYDYISIINNEQTVYEGVVGTYDNYKFCSGAGMLLNKKSVKIILENENLINSSWTDDIFIGYVLNKLNNIQPSYVGLNRYDVTENTIVTEDLKNYTHIRIKIRKKNKDIYFTNEVFKKIYN
jgi:hypothetical protein